MECKFCFAPPMCFAWSVKLAKASSRLVNKPRFLRHVFLLCGCINKTPLTDFFMVLVWRKVLKKTLSLSSQCIGTDNYYSEASKKAGLQSSTPAHP